MRTVILGRGRVGRGLAKRLRDAPGEWRLSPGRRPTRKHLERAELVVLAVPDGAIGSTAHRIAPWLPPRSCVVHCAGSLTAEVLGACREVGARVGAMHPLASFADPRHPPALGETTFVISGDRPAIAASRRVAAAVGANPLVLPIHGPAYHALAALVAGGSVGFAHAVIPVLERLGVERREAERAAAGLIGTVAQNIARIGLPAALTGPVVRGDASTVAAHRETLRAISREAAAAYDAVAPLVLECATAGGLSDKDRRRMRRALK